MRATRAQSLAAVKQGDIVYAIAAGGQEKLMLVYRATRDTIFARHVTTQTKVEFDRDGHSKRCDGGGGCEIVSVAPLPPPEHEAALGLDRKMRRAKRPDEFKLSQGEIQLLTMKTDYYRSRPLPQQ
jgi:hypothetical protein